MAIQNVSWSNGDKITSAKLSNMVADEVNTTDDIHQQYYPRDRGLIANACINENAIEQQELFVPFFHDNNFQNYDLSFAFDGAGIPINVDIEIQLRDTSQTNLTTILTATNYTANTYWNYFVTNASYITFNQTTGIYLLRVFMNNKTADPSRIGVSLWRKVTSGSIFQIS